MDKDAAVKIRLAQAEDVDSIYELMKNVYEQLEDKSIYVCDDREFVAAHIEEKGFIVIAYDGYDDRKDMAGCLIVRYPDSNDNLGWDIGLSDNELSEVVHMESAVVASEYRGMGLQRKMLEYAQSLIDSKNFHYLMATVSPDNPASYHTLERCGYRMMTEKEKYGGLLRRIYMKQI